MIIKKQEITKGIRVIIMKLRDGAYWIESQQYWTEPGMPWEVDADGWRGMRATWCTTIERAEEKFAEMVKEEQRWVQILGNI